MRNILFIPTLALLISQGLNAQNETRFYAEVKATEVFVGEPFQISFVLENGKNNGRFSPPDWEAAGFAVLRSNQSSNTSIMNGQINVSAAYSFTITPIIEGTLTIPAVSIKNDGGELQTSPIVVQALPSADGVQSISPKRGSDKPPGKPKRSFKTTNM